MVCLFSLFSRYFCISVDCIKSMHSYMFAKILFVYLLFCKLYGMSVCPVLLVLLYYCRLYKINAFLGLPKSWLYICCFVSCNVCLLSLFSWYSCNIGDHNRSMHSYVFANIGITFLALCYFNAFL